jgi:hypothetical protein
MHSLASVDHAGDSLQLLANAQYGSVEAIPRKTPATWLGDAPPNGGDQ